MTEVTGQFEVQATHGAFGLEGVPESAWYTVSRHRKLRIAREKKDQLTRDMHERCSPNAWDSHRRIVNVGKDLTLKMTWICDGWMAPDAVLGAYHSCETEAKETVCYTWQSGESMPRTPYPETWTGNQCPECHGKQDAAEYRAYEQWTAERERMEANENYW